MSALQVIALNGFREARRHRVTVVIAVFATLLILATKLVMEVTVATFDRVLTDFGLGTLAVLVCFLAIFLSSGLVSREIERRTVYLIVTRPMSRSAFLVGRWLGNLLTVAVVVAAMAALLFIELTVLRTPVTQTTVLAVVGIFAEAMMLASLGIFFSTMSSQFVSALSVAGLYFAGHLSGDIYRFSQKSPLAFVQWVGKAGYYLLPNLDRVDLKAQAAHELTVTLSEFGPSLVYAIGYSVCMVVFATLVFERIDLK